MKIAVALLKAKQNKIKKSSGMDSSGFATHASFWYLLKETLALCLLYFP